MELNLANERWEDIENFEGDYQVSNLGRVRSLVRLLPLAELEGVRTEKTILGMSRTANGTVYVALRPRPPAGMAKYDRPLVRKFYLHTLVSSTFNGPAPHGMVARQANGDKNDNRLDNLCYYPKEHCERKISKLTADQVLAIRASDDSQTYLAAAYGVTQASISQIISRKTWKELA